MKIITITGKSNSGKTTLIKDLYNQLKHIDAFELYFKVIGAHFEDFHSVLIWNGKVIAFCSIGDFADYECKSDDKLWPFTYVKEGFKLADDYKADIFINAKTSDLNEEDYKFLLKNFGYENFISYKMENEIFQKDCIKHNQKIKAQILDEIEK